MAKIKILIADDQQLFLDGIVSLLKMEKNFIIAATATDGYSVTDLFGKNKFDVCILDINMPGLNGLDTARWIIDRKYDTKIILLTMHNDREYINEMLLIGVSGYVLKNATKMELVQAINDVIEGRRYFSNEVHSSIMDNYLDKVKQEKNAPDGGLVLLTPREIEIVRLLAKEHINEHIANILHISYRTVETHRKNIMHKTNTKNLAGLIKYAYDKGILN